jgi:motility quorum-sensing regulator / GCU-specific mRNA interferase toxin
MEKWKPSYSLDDIKAAFAAGKAELKVTPKRDALKLGFDEDAIVATIQAIKTDFDKSMTSYGNHKIWQDVYHVPFGVGVLYIKFARDAVGFILLSFKERT